MGIEVQSVRLLAQAAELGVSFSKTLTIGRQRMMVSESEAVAALKSFGHRTSDFDPAQIAGKIDPFSSKLFELLGAQSVDALDYSDYEGATVIHDLNSPLPREKGARYTAVFDGGTLEHVFNLPTALASLMHLPEVGGHLIVAVPANNEMGHGFYQFSPELFFRTLSEENGYKVEGMFLAPFFCLEPWLMVRDPARAGQRVGYAGWAMPTYVLVIARRIAEVAPFQRAPQQTDYVLDWGAAEAANNTRREAVRPSFIRRVIQDIAPQSVLRKARHLRARWARPDPRSMVSFAPSRGGAAEIRSFYAEPETR
ncbi:hypothetical protein [Altererythrobacter sp. TH136]|uniref:hypothetical protein n=1 Tax=Altererythrobacter sp. TH136 TaxID=2067415 RepID=UPI0011624BAB|nr:hypothetical protein [Altererythrobacter sp. TH136]QDM41020.1 hypothetical protein C0V74_08250 [Altererythrobacter sp. TH136]